MRYYKVIKGDKHDYFTGNTTVINELLTPRERQSRFRYLGDDVFEVIELSRKKTYTCFGCRFETRV